MKGLILLAVFIILAVNLIRSIGKKRAEQQSPGSAGKRPRLSLNVFATQKRNEAWMEAACDFELEYVRPDPGDYPSLRGIYNGLQIEVEVESASDHTPLTTCYVNFKNPFALGLDLERHEDKLSQIDGSSLKDFIQSGLQVNMQNPAVLQGFLNEKRRNALRNAFTRYPYFEMADNYVGLSMDGVCVDASELNGLIEFTVSFAEIMENASDTSPKPAPSAPVVPPPSPIVKPIIMTPPVVPSPVVAAPVAVEESPLPPPVVEPVPETPAPVLPSVEEKPLPAAPTVSAAPSVPEAPEMLGQADLAAQLFSASFPGPKEEELFRRYKGSYVEWEGTLQSAYQFSSDFVLGNGPGVKAIFEIAEISGAYSMKSKIKALVRLPVETQEILKRRNGEKFRFSGCLERFEPFAKEIILLDGELLS